ncbi:hypothetical protein HOLleu_30356 [Holothuria leucospilota]|uniref:Uncharacterized protein n=1 Tax=Holothuria leucospilota TaxID=206669 RepID=A0A9Q1BKJ6_HOLLE|nr:hypothetical protein HOLleu_30356 [Holothuria leucospilota]
MQIAELGPVLAAYVNLHVVCTQKRASSTSSRLVKIVFLQNKLMLEASRESSEGLCCVPLC